MWTDSPVFEEISIRQFWSGKTRPGKNVDGQSSVWGNLNPSILVGKNTSQQKCGRTVQYLRKSQSVNFGQQKHVPAKMWIESPVGSWLNTWMMSSFLISWMVMICDSWLMGQISALWILGVWGHSWHHETSWYIILDLCAKFQHSTMNRGVSRTPRPWIPYLEDVDGSWLETWRTGSSLTCWTISGDPKEHILKVSSIFDFNKLSSAKEWLWGWRMMIIPDRRFEGLCKVEN